MLRIPNSNLLRYSFLICLLFLESIIYILFLQTFLFFLNKIHLYPKTESNRSIKYLHKHTNADGDPENMLHQTVT